MAEHWNGKTYQGFQHGDHDYVTMSSAEIADADFDEGGLDLSEPAVRRQLTDYVDKALSQFAYPEADGFVHRSPAVKIEITAFIQVE